MSIVALTMQRLMRDKGADAFKPMDEDRSVMEYARGGQQLCLQLMGEDDPQAWASSERLIRVMRTHGEYRDAEVLCSRVLERKIATNAEPSSVARTQRQLGGILDDLGRYDAAVRCFRGALEIQIKTLGGGHIDVASTKDSLAVTLWRQGHFQEAIILYDDALQVHQPALI
jgi:tetratricopeptide (TPR) repeat protein